MAELAARLLLYPRRCINCNQPHETGGEALECDHRYAEEYLGQQGNKLHRDKAVKGCRLCARGIRVGTALEGRE